MSAIASPVLETPAPEPDALAFAERLLQEQEVPRLARPGATRALALLLERSGAGPVVLSGAEGAHLCGFEPRTWWLVKRRLLELGHLVASTGGGPPSGRPGGRGKKGAYFVAPTTLERFRVEKTVKGPDQTLKDPEKLCNVSHHRPEKAKNGLSLRLLEKEDTSDVPSLGGDEARPTVEAVWRWIQRETSAEVKLGLLSLLETLLVTEALGRSAPPEETLMGTPKETLMAPPKRRLRSQTPLWTGVQGEEALVFSQAKEILEWANREHGASFPVEKSAKDMLLYPFLAVRGAVSNVLLKRARGYRFENPGAVLWDGITLLGYKLDEFSVANFSEVLERIQGVQPLQVSPAHAPSTPRAERVSFDPERKRRSLTQALYDSLPASERAAIDRQAETMAREELGSNASPLRLGFRKLDKRNELLAALPPRESQIPHFASE